MLRTSHYILARTHLSILSQGGVGDVTQSSDRVTSHSGDGQQDVRRVLGLCVSDVIMVVPPSGRRRGRLLRQAGTHAAGNNLRQAGGRGKDVVKTTPEGEEIVCSSINSTQGNTCSARISNVNVMDEEKMSSLHA